MRRKIALTLLAALMIFVIIPVAGIYFLQRLIVFPVPDHSGPATVTDGFAPVVITTADGERLRALYHPPGGQGASILVFHGSAEIAADQLPRGRALAAQGFGVLLAEYRGYAESSGRPSEAGLIADGLASYDYLARTDKGPIGILGHSLGAAVAVAVAAERPSFAVVLESPFLSLLEVTRYRIGWVPFPFLMRDPFRSDLRIGRIESPICIIHGTDDRVAPLEQGVRLAALANAGTEFVRIEGGGHNDLAAFDDMALVVAFFRTKNAARTASGGGN